MSENKFREILEYHDSLYSLGKPELSDSEYDKLKSEFKDKYPLNEYNCSVGSPVDSKVKLPYILGSLNKVKPDGTCQKWMKENKGDKVYWTKLDGVSGLVQYVDGKYNRSLTRGDGEYGQDITEKLFHCVPNELKENVTVSFRVEILLTGDEYKELGYKTRRNGVAGILNRDGMLHVDKLMVLFYELVDIDVDFGVIDNTEISRINIMKNLGVKVAPYLFQNDLSDEELSKLLKTFKESSPYDIDGIVIVLNESEREDTYYPDKKVAFKVNEEAVICEVNGITWQLGRTGRVVPVVNIIPKEIDGVTVSNSTGFNAEFIESNGIGIGSKVGIYRSGSVIPYIDYVSESVDVTLPSVCQSCGGKLKRIGVDLVCDSDFCIDRDTLGMEHFLTTLGCENVTAVTLKKLGLYSFQSLYEIEESDISKLDGFGDKRAKQIKEEINKTLSTTPAKLLTSFGISGIGETVSQEILKVVKFDDIWDVSIDELLKINGVGDVLADSFVKNINVYKDTYKYLLSKGLTWNTLSNNLMGMTFCLTGNGSMKRDELVKHIEQNGGFVKGMSKKVDYLVTNNVNSNSAKAKKAREYGKPIISYDELMVMLGFDLS